MNLLKEIMRCFYTALVDTVMHDGIEHAGYMAFLSLLSLFPFLVFLMAMTGFIGQSSLGLEFINIFISNIPVHVANAIQPRIEEIISGPPQSLLTLAIVGAIWTASSAVEGLRTILNRAYRVSTPPAYIWRRLLSILQFFILTLVIVSAMLVFIFLPIIWDKVEALVPLAEYVVQAWNYAIQIRYAVIGTVLFIGIASLYYMLPNIRQNPLFVLPGSIIVMLLWLLSGNAFSFYLGHFEQVNLIYGSLGGIIISLLFFYVANLIFIYGAEFNYHLEQVIEDYCQKVKPSKPQKKNPHTDIID